MYRLLLLVSTPLFAIQTAYVSFQEPDNWGCELAQGVWICQSNIDSDRRDSVILSIAAQATEWDTLANYEDYLKKTRTLQDQEGKLVTSEITYTRQREINGVKWMDSLQHHSELVGFWTRYLATVHQAGETKLAILITYIVSDEKYAKLAPQFEKMVASLKPATSINTASTQGNEFLDGTDKFGGLKADIIQDRLRAQPKSDSSNSDGSMNTPLMVLAGAIVVYLIIRRRLKSKPKPRKEPSQIK